MNSKEMRYFQKYPEHFPVSNSRTGNGAALFIGVSCPGMNGKAVVWLFGKGQPVFHYF
ncbi:MAG: hypothetical protein ABIS12_19440 [Bacteroidia bacterium]